VITTEKKYTFIESLDRLAQVAVHVGLGIEPGQTPSQELLISAPIEALALVRLITEHAYKAGVVLVSPHFYDDECIVARYKFARDESFDTTAVWFADGLYAAFKGNAARLSISGGNPALLAGQDQSKIARVSKVSSTASKPAMEMITRHDINWGIVASATPEWAALVFPDDAPEKALGKLWDAIFAASRVHADDPVAEWKRHSQQLKLRSKMMNGKNYAALRYTGPGTDLEIGLADDHKWLGGGGKANNGISCMPNIPTEEIFTTPHKDRVNGTVRSTKPLSHQGTLIKDIEVRFEAGRIVDAKASEGQEAFQRLIATDEGARRLGEVALVPHSSPISASGLLFFNTLFDENAASHIALGQAYSSCIRGGDEMDGEQLAAKGANTSLLHVDWMIGSGEVDVDGVTKDGTMEPLMRKGEWVTAV
jgi:aminopeptidase